MNATGTTLIADTRKWMTWPTLTPPSITTPSILDGLNNVGHEQVHNAPFQSSTYLTSAYSISGFLSKHWLPNELALEHAAQSELFAFHSFGSKSHDPQIWLEWYGQKAGSAGSMVYHGRFATIEPNLLGSTGERFVFRPVMQSNNGNGRRVSLVIRGPEIDFRRDFYGSPNPLGSGNLIVGDHSIQFNQPGRYSVELIGTVFWPLRTFTMTYGFTIQPNYR